MPACPPSDLAPRYHLRRASRPGRASSSGQTLLGETRIEATKVRRITQEDDDDDDDDHRLALGFVMRPRPERTLLVYPSVVVPAALGLVHSPLPDGHLLDFDITSPTTSLACVVCRQRAPPAQNPLPPSAVPVGGCKYSGDEANTIHPDDKAQGQQQKRQALPIAEGQTPRLR